MASDQILAGIGEANNFIALVLPVHHETFVDGPVDLGKLDGLDGVRNPSGYWKIPRESQLVRRGQKPPCHRQQNKGLRPQPLG